MSISYVNVPKDLAARRRSCEENLNQLRKEWLSEHVRVCSEFQHDSPYSRVGAPPGLSPCKFSFGSESTQKTSILGMIAPTILCFSTINFRCGTKLNNLPCYTLDPKPNNLPHHTSHLTLPSHYNSCDPPKTLSRL
jgi:hypothetical protein